jgi:hypothetical protein
MRRSITLVFFTGFIFSCHQSTGIKELVSGSDSVAINFFKGDGTMDSVFKVRIIRDKKMVQDIASSIESSSTKDFKCGYDGSLHFFKTNVVVKEIDFRMNENDCMHFSFLLDGKLYNTSLSSKAKELLRSINEK